MKRLTLTLLLGLSAFAVQAQTAPPARCRPYRSHSDNLAAPRECVRRLMPGVSL